MPSSESHVVVTIVGSPTPCVVLPRGQSRTVALTPRVQRLIDRGFVTVTARHDEIDPPRRKRAKAKAFADHVVEAPVPEPEPVAEEAPSVVDPFALPEDESA